MGMRKVVKQSKRFAGKWKDFTPWKTSQVDLIDEHNFVKYCCARKLTRMSTIEGMSKNNKNYLQRKQEEKTEFLKNICPHVKNKEEFVESRAERMEKVEKRSIIVKLPQQTDETSKEKENVDVKVRRKKVFKQKSVLPRSKSGSEVVQSSTFKNVADKLQSNRPCSFEEKEVATWGNYLNGDKAKECIERKVEIIERESSKQVKELATLICSPKNKPPSKVFVQSNNIELPVENRIFSQKPTKPDIVEKYKFRQTTRLTKQNQKEAKNDLQNLLPPANKNPQHQNFSLHTNSVLSRLPRLSDTSQDWELPTFKLAVNRANLQHKSDSKRRKVVKNKSMAEIANFAQSRSVARLCREDFHLRESPSMLRRWDGAEGLLYPNMGGNKQVHVGRGFHGNRDNRSSKLLFLK